MKIATLNVNGFKNYHKREKVFEICKVKNLDIVFIQETHICEKREAEKIEDKWGGKIF